MTRDEEDQAIKDIIQRAIDEGRIWYPDLWEIQKVLEAIDHDTAAHLRLCPDLDPKTGFVS